MKPPLIFNLPRNLHTWLASLAQTRKRHRNRALKLTIHSFLVFSASILVLEKFFQLFPGRQFLKLFMVAKSNVATFIRTLAYELFQNHIIIVV